MHFTAHPVDLGIFVVFLGITLIVGLSYGRNVETIQDYALGGRNFSTFTLTATIVATWFGGGFFYYTVAHIYSDGLSFIIAKMGSPLCLLITGQLLIIRMKEFLNNVSVAEALGKIYGKTVRSISAISGGMAQIGFIAMQFQVIARILALILDAQEELLTFISAAIVILYSTTGGIRAVTFTDVVQFFTFGTLIPILALIMWNDLQDPQQVADALANNPRFHFKEVVGWNMPFISAVALMLYYTTQGVTPAMFQRIAMARNINQARKAFTYSALIALLINLFMVWIAILLLADNPHLEPSKLVNYLIDKYAYIGFKGLLASGIVALAMSTTDSCVNTSVVLFTHDLAVPLGFSRFNALLTARFSTVIIGILGLLLSLYENDILSLLLLTGNAYLPIVGVPLWLAIFGFRSSKRAILIGMAAGFTTILLWRSLLAHTGIDSVMPAGLASLAFLLGSHYLLGEPGGWQKVAPTSPLGIERAMRRAAWQRRLQAIRNFKLYPYLQQNLPQQEGLYSLFGLYTIAATYTGFYTIGDVTLQSHREIYEGIYHTVLFATTAFITFPIWPPTVKSERFITFFWPIGIGAILFFAGMLLVILSQFHTMQVMVMIINLLIAILLLQWSSALILALSGVSLAVWFFKQYTGEALPWGEAGLLQFRIFYSLLLLTTLLIALFAGQQAYSQLGRKNKVLTHLDQENQANLLQAALENRKTLQALKGTGVERLLTIARDLQTIHLQGEEAEKLQAIQASLLPMAFQLQGIDTRAQDYLRLQIGTISIQSWLHSVQDKLQEKASAPFVGFQRTTQHHAMVCDAERLTTLLIKSIVALQASIEALPEEEQRPVLVDLEDTWLHYPLPDVAPGYIKQVQALRIGITTEEGLPPLAPSYDPKLATTEATTPETSHELEQLAHGRIIKAHYGYAAVSPSTLLYVIPVDVTEVRPKDMDKAYMELGDTLRRADDHFKDEARQIDAQAQEQAFLAALAARSSVDIGLVKSALELIKWYHGPVNRHSGEPFYLHPLAVAQIVLDYSQEEITIIGALLHDIVEDTPMLLEQLATGFGQEIAAVVDVVTHLQSSPGSLSKVKLSAEENIKMLERTGNTQALYVKLADRMHNMRTIEGHSSVIKQKQVATETMEFFVPLAERLGLQQAVEELTERCLAVLKKEE
ncbi:MAG: HD domain-containing protein [Bacteroidota bacterium]